MSRKRASRIRALDLCCGAGGWACAARGLPIDWVAVADWSADCLETWTLNHGADHPACQILAIDLSKADGVDAAVKAVGKKGIDLIVGAIPCEQLSTARGNKPLKAGELAGVHDLIDRCFEMVKRLAPRWWCFEDVIGVEAHLPGPLVCGLPYDCRRIWSDAYGPQKRLRTFFGSFPELAPPEPGPRTLGEVLRPGPYRTLSNAKQFQRSRSKWYGGEGPRKMRVQDTDRAAATVITASNGRSNERGIMVPLARVEDAGEPSPTIADFGSRHERGALVEVERDPFGRECPQRTDEPARTVVSGHGDRGHPVEMLPTSRERPQNLDVPARAVVAYRNGDELPVPLGAQARRLSAEEPSATLTESFRCDEREVADAGPVRVMEWQEAALVQGFPPDYVFAASWSRTWKLVAQAIPVYVGRAILKGIVAVQ